MGHATLLVQMEGLTFLTDPVFSQRASPVQFLGPKRVVPPALTAADPNLPKLDFVVIRCRRRKRGNPGSAWMLLAGFRHQLLLFSGWQEGNSFPIPAVSSPWRPCRTWRAIMWTSEAAKTLCYGGPDSLAPAAVQPQSF